MTLKIQNICLTETTLIIFKSKSYFSRHHRRLAVDALRLLVGVVGRADVLLGLAHLEDHVQAEDGEEAHARLHP